MWVPMDLAEQSGLTNWDDYKSNWMTIEIKSSLSFTWMKWKRNKEPQDATASELASGQIKVRPSIM